MGWEFLKNGVMMTAKTDPAPEQATLCPECLAGVLHMEYITYFTWLNEELITVPNFPAWVCDMCGRREYDARAVNWLNTLLSPAAGKRRYTQRRTPPPSIDRPMQ